LTSAAYEDPAASERLSADLAPVWQPALAQFAVKIGCTWPEKEMVGPHPHTPPVQAAPPEQTLPQPPQFDGLELVSTQLPPHTVWPVVQVHAPLMQLAPVGQTLPQAPQFAESVDVVVHVDPHIVIPAEHAHTPPEQPVPVGQILPHPPQLDGSLLVLTQLDPQTV
jgi:hypothetical protein